MPVRVAINGFGRIGRSVFRIGRVHPELDFVAVNDRVDSHTLAHLLKHDSIQGRFTDEVKSTGTSIIVGSREIPVFSRNAPEKLPWKDLCVDVVLESTGMFTSRDDAYKHIVAGAQKVVISAPGNEPGHHHHPWHKWNTIQEKTSGCLHGIVYHKLSRSHNKDSSMMPSVSSVDT